MSDNPVVIDTPEGIKYAQLLALRGMLRLEEKGLQRRGRSALAILKDHGFTGSRQKVAVALDKKLEQMLLERRG